MDMIQLQQEYDNIQYKRPIKCMLFYIGCKVMLLLLLIKHSYGTFIIRANAVPGAS